MIKGRYVCQIEVDFSFSDDDMKQKHTASFEEMRKRLMTGRVDEMFKEKAEDYFYMGCPKAVVTRQYADIRQEGEEHED